MRFVTATVTAITAERAGLQKVEVDGEPAYVLTQLIGPVALGDQVVVNTTAVELGLGTGGWHFVHWNLSREAWSQAGPGHVMKLRYTSLQVDTGAAEEYGGPDLADDLPDDLGRDARRGLRPPQPGRLRGRRLPSRPPASDGWFTS